MQEEMEDLGQALKAADVVYMTRVQRERFENQADYEKVMYVRMIGVFVCLCGTGIYALVTDIHSFMHMHTCIRSKASTCSQPR